MLLKENMILFYFRHHKIRENTIASFLSAANHVSVNKECNSTKIHCCWFLMKYKVKAYLVFFPQGAAYVEFDVHLSKDLVPIVYHDLTCCISTKKVTIAFGSPYLTVKSHCLDNSFSVLQYSFCFDSVWRLPNLSNSDSNSRKHWLNLQNERKIISSLSLVLYISCILL